MNPAFEDHACARCAALLCNKRGDRITGLWQDTAVSKAEGHLPDSLRDYGYLLLLLL